MKQYPIITTIIITMLLLTSCSASLVAPTPTPTVTIEPTPVATATPMPTATPRTEPYTIEECEAKLEAITGTDVTYAPMVLPDDSCYHYKDETYMYVMNRLNGKFCFYLKDHCDTSPQTVNIEDLEQIAIDEIMKYCPSLFDLEMEVEIKSFNDNYKVSFLQLSPIHRRYTGNSGSATIQPNGEIYGIIVCNNEDPSIADKPLKINREQAIEMAYKQAQKNIDKMFENPEVRKFDVFLDERDSHKLKVIFTVRKGRPFWVVGIGKIRTNEYEEHGIDNSMGMSFTIFTDTGEIQER